MGSRDQMRNLEIFRVGADAVNEFEYQKNRGEMTEQQEHHPEQQDLPPGPATEAERIEQVIADAHAKVEKRKRKASRGAGKKTAATQKSSRKKSTTKSAARSTAKKAASRSPVKKSAAKSTRKKAARPTKKSAAKSTAKKTAAKKKSASRKSPARKSAARRS